MRDREIEVADDSGFVSLAEWRTVKTVVPWSVVDEIAVRGGQTSAHATQAMRKRIKSVIYGSSGVRPQGWRQFRNLWDIRCYNNTPTPCGPPVTLP